MKKDEQLVPNERRPRPPSSAGVLDNMGFFRTPNGSFWDFDDEYFNRHGFDVHQGTYSKDMEYIPGPDWLSQLGCYPDEKEKYANLKYDDNAVFAEEDENVQAELFKGDFEDDGDDLDISPDDFKKLGIDEDKLMEAYEKQLGVKLPTKNKNQDDSWESFEEEES